MSAVGLGDIATCGELKANKIVAGEKEVTQLTVKGQSFFEQTLTTTATAPAELNGQLVCSSDTVIFPGLPTSDPGVAGRLWNSSGDLRISLG
jgi:hypothetical protein